MTPLTLDQLRQSLGEPTTADEIRNAAGLISITLAVLSAFASQRASSLSRQEGNLGQFQAAELRRDAWVDLVLATFGVGLLLATGPLFVAAGGRAALFEVRSAFFVLFCLLYLGIGFVVAWTCATTWRRGALLGEKTGYKPGIVAMLRKR